jgi:hypothetical protein
MHISMVFLLITHFFSFSDFLFFHCFVWFLCTCLLYSLFPQKCRINKIELKSTENLIYLLQMFCFNFNILFDKYSYLKCKNSQHESCRSLFSFFYIYG